MRSTSLRVRIGRTTFSLWALLAGCSEPSSIEPRPVPVPPATEPAAPVAASPARVPDVRGAIEPDLSSPALTVSLEGLSFEGRTVLALTDGGFADADVLGGANGLLVPALRDAFATNAAPLVLEIDPAVSFRTVSRVVLSLGQTGRTTLAFRVRREGALGHLPVTLPSLDTPSSALALTILLSGTSVVVSGEGSAFGPGCEAHGAGPTLPALDPSALGACLERLHARFPSEDTATVAVAPEVSFGDVARAMAATRGTHDAPLFPIVLLAATR